MATETVEVPMAGKIIEVKVTVGGSVQEGDVLCILESMKMENPILSPVSGVIKDVQVSPGQTVKAGEIIAVIDY